MTKDIVGRLRVKPLIWDEPDGPEGRAWLGHGTDMCQFYIRLDADAGTYLLPGDARGDEDAEEYPTLDDAKAAAQADFEARILSALDSLSPPDGVGLVRYDLWASSDRLVIDRDDDGEWVRYEDAAAALAAEKARGDTARAHRDALLTTYDESRKRHLAAETKAERMEAALRAVEEWWLSEGMKHFTGASYAIFAARAALATIPAKPETETKP